MLIGSIMENRMKMFGFTPKDFAEETMLDLNFINDIIEDNILLDEIDDFDLNVIATSLYCTAEYFYDETVRSRDVVLCSLNRGSDTTESNLTKAKLQCFMREFVYLKDALK